MADDPLDTPVHEGLYQGTPIQELAQTGATTEGCPYSVPTPEKPLLPEPKVELSPVAKFSPFAQLPKVQVPKHARSEALKTRLRVLYATVPPLPDDKKPDCDSCSAACCRAFLVFLSKEEYESGLYGKHAVKVSREAAQQLKTSYPSLAVAAEASSSGFVYLLEGPLGVQCPFLSAAAGCTIYDDRPLVCRSYTCVGDARITESMKTFR